MDDAELTKNYEEGFIERISEPLISEPLISESEGEKLLEIVITEWLEDENYSQKEIMNIGMGIAEYIVKQISK
ncbi:hypothetical protein IJT10_01175 [bacterium]|nr:hypothetical protein [bacterium]